MTFLSVLSYLSLLVQICFVTVSIGLYENFNFSLNWTYIDKFIFLAAGLYYLAELVEEYTVVTKKIITWIVTGTILIYVVFFITENFSWAMLLCGLAAQIFHAIILSSFPFIRFDSLPFIGAVILLFVNHYFAFSHFQQHYYQFSEVMAYFTLCLWLVPFALFVSLSANDNVLPTSNERTPLLRDNDVVTNYFSSKRKTGLLSLFSYAKESILPERNKKAF